MTLPSRHRTSPCPRRWLDHFIFDLDDTETRCEIEPSDSTIKYHQGGENILDAPGGQRYYEFKKRYALFPSIFFYDRIRQFVELRFFHSQQHIDNLKKESFNYESPDPFPWKATSPVSIRPNRCHSKAGHCPQRGSRQTLKRLRLAT